MLGNAKPQDVLALLKHTQSCKKCQKLQNQIADCWRKSKSSER